MSSFKVEVPCQGPAEGHQMELQHVYDDAQLTVKVQVPVFERRSRTRRVAKVTGGTDVIAAKMVPLPEGFCLVTRL